jgi:hypothetical protein
MPNSTVSVITIPVNVEGTITNVSYDIKDAFARQKIEDLGDAVYWMGVTTTTLTDGSTTTPITVNSESVTPNVGGMAQYSGEEFIWNGTAWQSVGKNNFGALAFKSSASGSYTPAGTITVTDGEDTTTTVNSITAVGTLPEFTVSGETLTFSPGTLPTKGDNTTVVTASGTRTASFGGTAATISVE